MPRTNLKEPVEAILNTIFWWSLRTLGFFIIATFLIGLASDIFRVSFDETDNYEEAQRSGFTLMIDWGTGLQYLKTPEGMVVPRMGPDGQQMMVDISDAAD